MSSSNQKMEISLWITWLILNGYLCIKNGIYITNSKTKPRQRNYRYITESTNHFLSLVNRDGLEEERGLRQ